MSARLDVSGPHVNVPHVSVALSFSVPNEDVNKTANHTLHAARNEAVTRWGTEARRAGGRGGGESCENVPLSRATGGRLPDDVIDSWSGTSKSQNASWQSCPPLTTRSTRLSPSVERALWRLHGIESMC